MSASRSTRNSFKRQSNHHDSSSSSTKASSLKKKKKKNNHRKKKIKVDKKVQRLQKIIDEVKLKCRSELKLHQWSRKKHSKIDFAKLPYNGIYDTVVRIDAKKVSVKSFRKIIEKRNIPALILNEMDHWRAMKQWTPKKLGKNYRNEKFKVGEDDDENTVYMSMKNFMKYALQSEECQQDDSPLYIFDSAFSDRKLNDSAKKSYAKRIKQHNQQKKQNDTVNGKSRRQNSDLKGHHDNSVDEKSQTRSLPTGTLLKDYEIPKYFTDDYFKFTGEKRRPPYRWIVIGPGRSGTGIHVDPLGTSAWNALISGHKRWVLFPPSTPREVAEPKKLSDHEAVTWFTEAYPKFLDEKTRDADGTLLADRLGMVEVIQKPGEIMFVPGGWHHVVMNLDMTVAVTQNFCSRSNIEYVWLKTKFSRPRLARKLLDSLQQRAEDPYEADAQVYKKILNNIEALKYVPRLFTTSSGSSSSSSDSSNEPSSSGSSDSSDD